MMEKAAEFLQDLLASSADARVVWVGSSEGEQRFFDSSDFEGRNSINPYGSNKFCLYIISQFLNKRYQRQKLSIRSIVTAPGILPSNIAASMVPSIFIPFLAPFFWILRFFLNIEELTIDAHSAAEAIIYTATVPLEQLYIEKRADSVCSRLGAPSVCLTAVPCISEDLETKLYEYLLKLNSKFSIHLNTKHA
ncbi:3-keto-steroid reductase [Entomophthora muscae]|uniref:3-keto-steroid reductase n=1 Tax=Entomophthora muscae TaxID=34485 RepID=A0ACC2RFT2_9FUNG|nr:3-keto-steroid reductase [Entomophthora muscae]